MDNLVVTDIDRNRLVITQANRLIEASYQVTLKQKKLIQIMVGRIRKDDTDFQEYIFRVTDLQHELDLQDKSFYDDLKNLTAGLIGKVLKIRADDGREIQASWLASAVYLPKGTGGLDCSCVKLAFAPVLKPFLLQLKEYFAQYEFSQIAGMRSVYSIRMYEILNSRRRLHSVTFELDELKRMFLLEKKYKIARDFRIFVIEQAQREMQEKTNLSFEFVENRTGRKVTSITFNIRNNEPTSPQHSTVAKSALLNLSTDTAVTIDERQPQLLPPTEAEQANARLYHEAITEGVKNGILESRMRELLSTRNPAHVIENIEIARKRHMSAKGDGGNLPGLTVAAITNDYAADGREKRQKATDKVKARERAKVAKELLERIETAATVARRHDLTARLAALPEAERDALRAAFVAEVEEGKHGEHTIVSFRARGWKATGVEIYFRMFAAGVLNIKSEDEYKRAEAERLGRDYKNLKADAK